jgi:hypothetical protein
MLSRCILYMGLLLAGFALTPRVHTFEQYVLNMPDCSGQMHAEGDGDQSPPDADHGAPHHHTGCHGPGAFTSETKVLSKVALGTMPDLYFFPASSVPPSWIAERTLRPPIS